MPIKKENINLIPLSDLEHIHTSEYLHKNIETMYILENSPKSFRTCIFFRETDMERSNNVVVRVVAEFLPSRASRMTLQFSMKVVTLW